MNEVERWISSEFEMGALATSRHAFYERLDWERWRGRTYLRDGACRDPH